MANRRVNNNSINNGKKTPKVRRKRQKKRNGPNSDPSATPMKTPRRPQFKRKNVVKRLNNRNKNNNRGPAKAAPHRPINSYTSDLAEFLAMRNPETKPSTSITAIPSQELLWIRDETIKETLEPVPVPILVDDEIEEGEIVEREVYGIVDLLAESLAAVKQSRTLVDQSPSKLFFEDRTELKFGQVPKYKAFGETSIIEQNVSDDVIILDSSQTDVDDSVIFVSEDRPQPLTTPDCLKAPVVNSLMSFVPLQSTQKIRRSPRKLTKARKDRIKKWQEKKSVEFASENAIKKIEGSSRKVDASPSTSKQEQTIEHPRRIVLLDGSNLAMQFTDNNGTKKTDKDFSAEGLKIAIDHFEQQGFQVKAIVPEFRVRRDKSSNHNLMNELKNKGKLVCTPSKAYDDRVILESAMRLDAVIVSNDHFRDLIQERPEFVEVVKTRLLRYNWLFGQLLIHEDPHGRDGPKRDDILFKKPIKTDVAS